jgi:hypothetical protein
MSGEYARPAGKGEEAAKARPQGGLIRVGTVSTPDAVAKKGIARDEDGSGIVV